MRVVPIANLKDNYAYLVVCEHSGQAAIVDPGEAEPVVEAIRREGVTPIAIWATHHHGDHVGGNPGVLAAFPGLAVIAHEHDHDRVPGVTQTVGDAAEVQVGSCRARIIHNPGHTLGAISYWLEADDAVFTGDTLFGAGCGRLFEGTAAMMHTSLTRLAALPPATRVYFGHEYTVSNLAFAQAVEPDNPDVAARLADARARRDRGVPTTPSTIADEQATNPFVAIRRWKDGFKG